VSTVDLASITIQRRIDWMDTDAAGIYHWTTALRLAEAAEAALHTALGIADSTFGWTPRVRVSCEFHAPLRFNDLVDVHLAVAAVGRTSLTQTFRLDHKATTAASGELVMCHVADGHPTPWPQDLRDALTSGGHRQPVDT
jgi:acyl-CoA thioester hydrolase